MTQKKMLESRVFEEFNDPSCFGQFREEQKHVWSREKVTVEHEILKENHDTLMKDYECLQERIKHADETYVVIKLHLQNKAKELEVSNKRSLEECVREISETVHIN